MVRIGRAPLPAACSGAGDLSTTALSLARAVGPPFRLGKSLPNSTTSIMKLDSHHAFCAICSRFIYYLNLSILDPTNRTGTFGCTAV